MTPNVVSVENQLHGIGSARNECWPQQHASGYCSSYFDEIACWPMTPANTLATMPCPNYINGFNSLMNATRFCTESGKWYVHPEYNKSWTNYTLCPIPMSLTVEYFPIIKHISRIGYSVSLCSLLIAFVIMVTIKKLHCPRNKLHMHLFASFILRAGLILLKDMLFEEGVALPSDLGNKNIDEDHKTSNWTCKFMISLWEYFIIANYSWILMEGLYLHNLIYRALFADCSRKISHYVVLGWGLPVLVIIPWIITRALTEDTLCWTTHKKDNAFLIIQVPVIISIVINFVLFVKIAVVIYSKLQAPVYEEARRYQKWARSTLVLVPLFGIHYALFLGLSYFNGRHEVLELIWLGGDQLFASFQGFFVAVLYCFLNGEVRSELKPHFQSMLMCCATNEGLKYCFPCRDQYLRSARARASVCTTLSYSSVYNNGMNPHRASRTKWDLMTKNRNSIQEKNKEHICRSNIPSWQEASRWNGCSPNENRTQQYTFCSSRSIPETVSSMDQDEKCRSEPLIGEDMVPKI